jgi:hypothetical protein
MDRTTALLTPPTRAHRPTTATTDERHDRRPCLPADDAFVARLMTAIAAGHSRAIWELRWAADEPVRMRLRMTLHRLEVPYDADDLDGMVTDAVLAIADIASAWRPGGAPPWVWARHRVDSVVYRFVGTFAKSLEALVDDAGEKALDRTTLGPGAGLTGFSPVDAATEARIVLRRLACDSPAAALLDAALSEAVSDRDAAIWLGVLDEREAGNRHPAVTVGARFGLRPEAVRKAVQRVGHRLRQAAEGTRFADLASLPILAAHDRDEHPVAA